MKNNTLKKLVAYKDIFDENVRWGDTDGYNHVNNVSISRYFESARVNIIRNLESEKYSFVIVNFNINYISQIFYPSKIKIGTSISNIGKKSIGGPLPEKSLLHEICLILLSPICNFSPQFLQFFCCILENSEKL